MIAFAPPAPPQQLPRPNRTTLVTAGVLAAHAAALWALQVGLAQRPAETIVPVVLTSEIITPAKPEIVPEPVPPQPQPEVKPVPRQKQAPRPRPDPAPVINDAPVLPSEPAEASPEPVAEAPKPPVPAAPVAAAAAPAPPAVELPSSNADYLQNPKPAYPPMSRRLGEQGKVIVRVLIGADGNAQSAEIRQSSGYARLDQAALETVRKWRYVPGKRGGVPETMWFNVPINFVLE